MDWNEEDLPAHPCFSIEPYLEVRRRKVEEPEKSPCDVDDLLCQMGVINNLRGIEGLVGDERFKQEFPEFSGLRETVTEKIRTREISLREAYRNCGEPNPSETIDAAPAMVTEEGNDDRVE